MIHPQRLVIGLLACLAFASAVPALFPRDKITTYKYYAEVQSGTSDPTSFASEFVISGLMHVTPEISDPNLKNAFYVSLDVTHGIRNGEISLSEKIVGDRLQPIPDAAKALKDPFVAVFDDSGKVNSLIVNANEAEWSRSMKKSIASMLQLDLSAMHLEMPLRPQTFSTNESTLYGECTVNYDIRSEPEQGAKMFVVTKSMNPMECTKFRRDTFNSEESADCWIEKKDTLDITSKKIFDIENNGENLLIKKLVAHGKMNYSPSKDGSQAHYVLSGQTMNFESSVPVGSITLPTLNINEMVSLTDMTFQKPQSKYADKAGVDLTYGRHVVDRQASITKLIEMLREAVDYMDENHLEMTAPEMKHGQTMNRILDTMSYMDIPSLESVANRITDESPQKKGSMRQIFLQLLPFVGTYATSLYIEKIIRDHTIPSTTAIAMLTKLPFYVRAPTEELLVEMEDLTSFGVYVSPGVRKAGILAFATLIHKAHRYEEYDHTLSPELVSGYVNQYFARVMNETSYDMKMLYIQAMKNIGTGDVFRLLKPIVSGEVIFPEKSQHLRLMAMYAYEGANSSDVDIDGLFWPILENTESPLEIRATALTILFKQPPQMERFMKLLVLMEHEKNEHLYNYYYTTMKSFAGSSSSCRKPLNFMASTVLLDYRVRRPASADLLTTVWSMDYENEYLGYGESWTGNFVADEHTGTPFFGVVEYSSTDGRKPVDQVTLFLRVEGFDNLVATLPWDISTADLYLPIEKIENLLKKASEDMPGQKPIHVEFAIMHQGRFVMTEYIDKELLPESISAFFMGLYASLLEDLPISHAVTFEKLYTKQLSNDLGLPTVFETRKPRVVRLQKHLVEIPQGLKIEIGTKYWSHGYQSMEVYNPIIDTWHAVRRVSAVDLSLPFVMSIKSNNMAKGFVLSFPRLPTTQYSVSYHREHHKNYVMVRGTDEDVLGLYCPDCNMTEAVTGGEEHQDSTLAFDFDSIDTGLRMSVNEYDCDTDDESLEFSSQVFEKFVENMEDMQLEDLAALWFMTVLEHSRNMRVSLQTRSCGYLFKIEPSHVYPTSEIDINILVGGSTALPTKLSLPSAINFDFNVTVVVKAESTKDFVQSWSVTGSWNSTEGYLQNDFQLDIARRRVGAEEYYKLCIDAHKTYPPLVSDPFDRTVNPDSKTTGQLRVVYGGTATEACPTHGLLRFEMEGKMSEEQKEALKHGEIHDACQRDINNPLYMYAESSIVPRTPACLREALLRTTLRQYVFDVFYQNDAELLEWVTGADQILTDLMSPNSTTPTVHTEPGNAKLIVEFPLNNKGVNFNVRTHTHETKYIDVLNDDDERWNDVLDNIYFSSDVLDRMRDRDDRFCVIYPEILMNADGANVSYTVPGQWTLLTGDYKNHLFSVFVKSIEPKKLGLLLSVTNHTIEVIPTDTNPTVTVDGNVISYDNDFIVPAEDEDEDGEDSLAYRITWSPNPKRFQIETTFSAFDLEWTERSVSLVMSSILRGHVTGLCGHLDGSYEKRLARVYTLDD